MTWVLQSFIPRESTTVSLRYWKWHRATVLQVGKHRKRKVSNEADCLWVGALWGYCHCCVPSGSPKVPVGLSLEKTLTAQPPVLPLGQLCAPEVSNATCLHLGAGVKVHNSLPLPFKNFFVRREQSLFPVSKILKAHGRRVAIPCAGSTVASISNLASHTPTSSDGWELQGICYTLQRVEGKVYCWSDSQWR